MPHPEHEILIVDDDPDIREAIHDILVDEGWLVRDASDGLEAKALILGGLRPCAILLDLMMPRMSGDEFLTWLRREETGISSLPVIVLSAMPDPVIEGAQDALRKPVQLRHLVEAIERFCAT